MSMGTKVYLVEYDPLHADPNGWYIRMTDAQAKDLRAIFNGLHTEGVLREYRIDYIEDLAMPYKDFGEILQDLRDLRKEKPKDWFPGA